MNRLCVVIPSRNIDNLLPCLEAIRHHEPTVQIVVVDDGLESQPSGFAVEYVQGVKPFVFARNVNAGIRWASDADICICNDDALLRTPGGFTAMQARAGEYGIVGAATNNVGNVNQMQSSRRGDFGPRDEPRMLCFVCVFIPRSTIDAVGLLDERYVGYGMDDDDYSLQVRRAGLKLGVFDGCFVDHTSLRSSYRGPAGAGGNFHPNMKLFIEKWNVDNWGRGRDRSEFRALFPPV